VGVRTRLIHGGLSAKSPRGHLRAGALVVLWASSALGLDKQGSAHGGAVADEDDGAFNVSGAATLGVSLINASYAARPDNTGLALFRYALHSDIDLLGRRLSIPVDVNLFTDRERGGARIFAPSEFDFITGVTTTHALARGADLEVGTRVENDRPVDRGSFTQTYVDARARLLYSLARAWPSLGHALVDGDISGYATAGWFAFNPSYAARPDNTGLALFRYVGHTELSVGHDHWSVGLDGTFFTDRRASNVFAPSELDLTYEVIGRRSPFEVHVAYERDMPVDRGGLVQSFVYVLAVYDFDWKHDASPLETRGTVPSP
jgi:hypothetical protein